MATKKAPAKKPMTGGQAKAVANFLKNKGAAAKGPVPNADAEDQIDGGVDENEE